VSNLHINASQVRRWVYQFVARSRVSLNTTIVLVSGLCLLSSLLAMGFWARSRVVVWEASREEFSQALDATRVRLSSALSEVAGDEALVRGMDWGLDNSVTQLLGARLRAGELDGLALYDDHCRALVESHGKGVEAPPCQVEDLAATGKILWKAHQDHPVLATILPLPQVGGARFFARGFVTLSDAWLEAHPGLRGTIPLIGARVAVPDKTMARGELLREGVDEVGQAHVALLANDALARLIPGALARSLSSRGLDSALFFLALLLITLSATILIQERRRERRHRASSASFLDWAVALSPSGVLSEAARTSARHGIARPESAFAAYQELISRAIQTRIDANRVLQERKVALEQKLDVMKKEMITQERRIGELAALDSLSMQMHRLTASFLQRVKSLQGNSDELAELVRDGVGPAVDDVGVLMREWQIGTRERGARKFLRGLSETEGSIPGQSVLDEQIAFLKAAACNAGNQTVKAVIATRRFRDDLDAMTRVARLWRGLALPGSEEEEDHTRLGSALRDACRLFELDLGEKPAVPVAQLPCLSAEENELLLRVPASPLAAALYHILLCMHEHADAPEGQAISIVGRVRQDGEGRWMFVFLLNGVSSRLSGFGRGNRQSAWNMQVADHLLAPYGVQVLALPKVGDMTPVAIQWTPAEASSQVAETSSEEREDYQSEGVTTEIEAPQH
jgi:hypothetical protein